MRFSSFAVNEFICPIIWNVSDKSLEILLVCDRDNLSKKKEGSDNMNSSLFEPEVQALINLDGYDFPKVALTTIYQKINASPRNNDEYFLWKGLLLSAILERHNEFTAKQLVAKIALLALINTTPKNKDTEMYKTYKKFLEKITEEKF